MAPGRTRTVVKQLDVDLHMLEMSTPSEKHTEDVAIRNSTITFPLIQVDEMPFVLEGEEISLICTDEYANFVASVEEHVAGIVAEKSLTWFGKVITFDQCEKMLRSGLDGHTNPKHSIPCANMRVFDHETKPCECTSTGCAVLIIRIEGLTFYEKECELNWSVFQLKLSDDSQSDSSTNWIGQ